MPQKTPQKQEKNTKVLNDFMIVIISNAVSTVIMNEILFGKPSPPQKQEPLSEEKLPNRAEKNERIFQTMGAVLTSDFAQLIWKILIGSIIIIGILLLIRFLKGQPIFLNHLNP